MNLPAGSPPGVAELEAFAVDLADGAATRIGERIGRRTESWSKSSATDLVTELDGEVEEWLISRIAERRPLDGVLGEERGGRPGTSGVRWVLDPIDGTVNFVLGLPQFAVSVAAELDGAVVVGAVANPSTGEIFRACVGGGAWLGSRRLAGPRLVPLPRAVIGTGFGYGAARRQRQGQVVAALLGRIGDIRRLGAASLDLCAVATGRLDGYFEAGLNLWDYAAGALVATEAGCLVSGLRGQAASPQFVVAAGADLAPALVAVLTELDADQVTMGER